MKTKSKKFIKAAALGALLIGGYLHFSGDLKSEADTTNNPLASSLNEGAMGSFGATGTDSQITQDTAFLQTLTSLTRIKIDVSLFANKSFRSLKNNEVVIEPVVAGRPNPFASIDLATSATNTTNSAQVSTDTPTQITTTAAVLNGTTNVSASTSYFEYGTTSTLGKTTPASLLSLVGTFNTKITGLTPKTQYFARAVSKIGGVLTYGEVVSFNTN